MKFLKNIGARAKSLGLALGVSAGLLMGFDASAASPTAAPPITGWFTNGANPYPLLITSGQTITFNSTNPVPLFRGRGMAMNIQALGTNASSTTNMTCVYDVSNDLTNWTSGGLVYWNSLMTGNAAVRNGTNVPPDVLDNWKYVRLSKFTWTGANNLIITNAGWSVTP